MANEKVFLSIIVITYNQEKTIEITLDSILKQSITVPYEILIGDDGSTDKTREILMKYQKDYPDNVKVILNAQNMGVVNNYFNLLKMCSGELIMECAGDDYWLENKVEKQLSFMKENPNVLLYYGKALKYFDDEQRMSSQTKGDKCESFEELLCGNKIPALTVCFRNAIAQEFISKIKPEEKNWKMEDYPLWLWMAKKGEIRFENDLFAVYRVSKESISHSGNFEKKKNFIDNIEQIAIFFAEGKEHYLKQIRANKNREMAWLYLQFNDQKMYRKHIVKTNNMADKIRYVLALSTKGFDLLRQRMEK